MINENEFLAQLLDPKTQEIAFRALVKQYQRPLYAHVRNIVLNHDDADDVLQNTFIKVFQYLKSFKGESKIYSWMYRIATNEALTFLSQKAKLKGVSSEELQNSTINNLQSDSYFDGDALQIKLQLAVASLPEKQQLIFKMKYFQGLKYEVIGEILGTSVGALKASYHHAVKKIEKFINGD